LIEIDRLNPLWQYFPTFLTCYQKSHPDVGRYPQLRTNNNIFFHRNAHYFSVARPIKMEQVMHYNQ